MDGEVREVQLKRSDSFGYGFSVFGGKGSGFPPVIYDVVENSPAAVSGELEAGDIILEVNDRKVVSLTTKEVLKSLRLSNDVVTLKVKKDTSIKEKVHNHMAASNELEALRRSNVKENSSNNCHVHKHSSEKSESIGDKENSENIPPSPSPRHEPPLSHNHNDIRKSQPRPQQPKFETFMMTGDLIINLNTNTSNSALILPSNNIRKQPETVIPYGQCSIPTTPEEEDSRLRSKANKREASEFHSPVAEKKGNYNYNGHFVRTSRSEDHLQKVSVSAVNIDLEDDVATSLNTLLDPNKDNPNCDRIVWTYNSPVSVNGPKSLPYPSSAPESNSSLNQQSREASPSKKFSETDNIPSVSAEDISQTHRFSERDQETFKVETYRNHSDPTIQPSWEKEVTSDSDTQTDEDTSNNEMFTASNRQRYSSRTIQPKQDGVTNIVVDENKIYVKVLPDQNVTDSDSTKFDKLHNNSITVQQSYAVADERRPQFYDSRQPDGDTTTAEEHHHGTSSPIEDESDVESLRSFHYSPKAIDMPSASRLAKRLYNLEGFKKSDVSRHLCKNNDFSRVVAEEYLKFFDFNGQTLDIALRMFLKQFCLIGETQERERVLIHFSKRFLDCNPGAFKSQDAVHTLTCALMLLNTDLYGENVGRGMTCAEFIENLTELNEGENFPKDVLKALYHSIKSAPLEWAVDDEEETPEVTDNHVNSQDVQQSFIGHNPFLEVPNPNCATEYKKGYVMRKCCVDPNGKKTPLGKRGWKMFYATLRDLVLYLHKDENGFRKNQLYDSLHNSIRIHHALATKAVDYTKKQHVFRLQTADQAEYLFQTRYLKDDKQDDSKELQSWIDTINYVAASLSSPPLAGGVGSSQKKFQRPLLPVSHTKLNFREQLQDIESSVLRLEKELEEHLSHAPDRSAKSRIVHEFVEKEAFLQFELKRYRTYSFLLHSKMAQFPEFEPPLVETSIGEVDELSEKGDGHPSPVKAPPSSSVPDSSINVKRSLSDRYSYRAAIYKTGSSSDGI